MTRTSGFLICVLMITSLGLFAGAQQITGTIRGAVMDPTGAVVEAATVTARQLETGLSRTVLADRAGNFVLIELPVGHYQLEVTAKGFQIYLQQGISLNVNENLSVPVHLAVGTESEKVQVSADAQLIQSTVTSLGKTVYEQEVLDLPLNGRNFTQLGTLQPGVVPLTPGLQQAGGSLRANQSYAVNGQRPESNNFLIDGANNFDGVDGGFVLQPPVDAITEFRILTHNSNAEFGHSTGSTTNIITRSGTNQIHGAAWEFLRNDAFDARNFFADKVEPLKRNQFGGTLGGPIRRDKTFLFGYYEGLRNRRGQTFGSTVPSLKQRQGDFSELCPEQFDPNTGMCNNPDHQLFNIPAQAPVPFNQFQNFVDPFSQNLLTLFPLPNRGPNSFFSTQTFREDSDQFGFRLDHYLSGADVLNARYVFSQGNNFNPLSPSGASVPGFPVTEDHRAQNLVLQETHTFSPTMVGVFRFSYLRNKFLFSERTSQFTPESLGFQYQPSLDVANGAPFMQVNGYTTVGDPITGPRNTYENAFDYTGSLNWVRGRHELKFGAGYEHLQVNALQGIATNGFFVFAPFPFTDAFASFLAGQPVFFLQGRGDFSRGIRGNGLNAYAQDTYKVSSRLTLNYGLRYELPFPYTEIKNRQTLWIPGRQSKVLPNAPSGLLYPGDSGVSAGLIPAFKKGFAPRVGFAWDPTGVSKWLVTAAYGIFYEPYYTGQGGPLQSPISAPPYLQTAQVNGPNFSDPFQGKPPAPGEFAKPLTNLTLTPNLPLPYAQDWDLSIQRSLGTNLLFEIGYVGTKGTKLPRFIEGNPTVYIPGVDGQGNPISTSGNADQRRIHSGCTLADPPSNCIYSSTGLIAGIANSSYNALEASLRKRFSHGLAFLASYTYSKAIDDVSSFNLSGSASKQVAGENDLAQDPGNLAAERGPSLFDARHRFVVSYEWSIPFWRNAHTWYQHALGNWQVNGITTFMSGTPFTVFDSRDVSQQGGAPEITGFSANRPDLVPGRNPNNGPRSTAAWLNADAFQRIEPNPMSPVQQFGTAGRNVGLGPRYANFDFSAFKNIRLSERKQFQFRAEFFNIFNHANFRLPDSDISSPTFNHIQAAQDPRLVQLALKFLF